MATFTDDECCFDVCAAHPERELVNDLKRLDTILEPLEKQQTVTSVKLGNKSYSAECAAKLGEALSTLDSVVSVDVADVIAGRPEAEALMVLGHLSKAFEKRSAELVYVDVSDNALGQKGIDALLPLLKSKKIATLKVCNNGMSAEAAQQLAGLLDKENGALVELEYYNNMSGDGGASAIAEVVAASPLLEKLRFSGTRTTRAGSLVFATAVSAHLTRLVKLDLADNLFGAPGGLKIADSLRKCPNLLELNLRDCSLADAGFSAISKALVEAKTPLTHLDLSGNEISKKSNWRPLLMGLGPSLTDLAVEENEVGNKGAASIAAALESCPFLATIQLSTNEISDVGGLALATAIAKSCPAIKSVVFNGNALSDDALETFESLLPEGSLGEMDDNDEDLAEEDDDDEEDEEEDVEEDVDNEVDELADITKALNVA